MFAEVTGAKFVNLGKFWNGKERYGVASGKNGIH